MTDETTANDETRSAAREAAQRVVEDVSSWQYSAEHETVAEALDVGLREAEVTLSDDERSRVLSEIEEMKDESSHAPQVRDARPIS